MENTIVYHARRWTLGTQKRYYFGRVKGKHWSLHRYKYTQEKGIIPKGWHVHHKDQNVFNNEIENLEALPPKKHFQLHMDALIEKGRRLQPLGKEAAKIWHASEEGITWHTAHYQNVKDKLHEIIERNCNFCGQKHNTHRKSGNAFCSNKCKSAWRRKNKPDKKIASCPTCSKEFETLKYLPNVYCSRQCKPPPNPRGYHARNSQ